MQGLFYKSPCLQEELCKAGVEGVGGGGRRGGAGVGGYENKESEVWTNLFIISNKMCTLYISLT